MNIIELPDEKLPNNLNDTIEENIKQKEENTEKENNEPIEQKDLINDVPETLVEQTCGVDTTYICNNIINISNKCH